MDDIVSQIHTLASKADHAEKVKIQDALRRIVADLENSQDTVMQLYNGQMRLAVEQIGIKSGLFRSLSQSEVPLSVVQLAERSKASPDLFERIVRFLVANQFIEQVDRGHFKANRTTHILGSPGVEIALNHMSAFSIPAMQAFPAFVEKTGYADITENTNTPFQMIFHTDLAAYDWLAQNPERAEAFKQMMKLTQSGGWMAGFEEFHEEALKAQTDSARMFFVDIGGSSGHQCIELRDKYPSLKGRLVLQDLPQVMDELPEIPGVRKEAADFFQGQNVKGAKFYYLRRIFHNWPDARCVQILKNVRAAMAPDSQILIDEAVVPETNVSWRPALADLAMMILMGGKERTRTQWAALAEQSGLRIAHVHEYSNDLVSFHSVVQLELDS